MGTKEERMIKAMEETIAIHEMSEKTGIDYENCRDTCPLCDTAIYCADCPWVLLAEEPCIYNKNYDYRDNKESIKRLKKWIKIYKTEMGD